LLKAIDLSWPRYRDWKERFGLPNQHNGKIPRDFWLEPWEVQKIINFKIAHPEIGYRFMTYKMMDDDIVAVSPATTYRILRLNNLISNWNYKSSGSKKKGFDQPLKAHEHWHTDISYINYHGTFLFLIGVLDGFSRLVVHHELRTNMQEYDVEVVLQKALEKYPNENPRVITDNGSQFISNDFKRFLRASNLEHVRTSVNHPQSNGKIEAWHKTIKNECIRKQSFLNLGDARSIVEDYVYQYNFERLHSGIGYITPFDKISGKANEIFKERDRKLEDARKRRKDKAKTNKAA
jgi:putative transposase